MLKLNIGIPEPSKKGENVWFFAEYFILHSSENQAELTNISLEISLGLLKYYGIPLGFKISQRPKELLYCNGLLNKI